MSILAHHNEWLSLVPHSGPFISIPALKRVFPQGLDGIDREKLRLVRAAYADFAAANESGTNTQLALTQWVHTVIKDILDFPSEIVLENQMLPGSVTARVPEYQVTLRPTLAICEPSDKATGKVRLLVSVLPNGTDFERPATLDGWRESPIGRMAYHLRATGIQLGMITDGDTWTLISAVPNRGLASATWEASLWTEEPITFQAFCALLCSRRFFGVAEGEQMEALFAESVEFQQEVTEQLGLQVRRAIEILVYQLDRANRERKGELLNGVAESDLYEAAVTFMMRLVFLFFAEENKLLPIDDELYATSYAASTIREQLRELADKTGEEVLERQFDSYSRLLATFRAVHSGARHQDLAIPPYGGHLFDPDRFPFLEGRKPNTSWRDTPSTPLPIHNRTVLHLLEALQTIEGRNLSFRSLDIEQIGHVYEGLLDHTVKRAAELTVSLKAAGKFAGDEPEVGVSTLEEQLSQGAAKLAAYLKDISGIQPKRSEKALALEPTPEDRARLAIACENDEAIVAKVLPFLGIIRRDSTDLPVVIARGGYYVTRGSDRRSSGTHYTLRVLTELIVPHALDPVCYFGPAEGIPREEWRLKSSTELLQLKICDFACGSGAFLVQACRYLSARIVEGWAKLERDNPGKIVVTPEGMLADQLPSGSIVPRTDDERIILARRLVAERCLYGVDKNHLAAEMAKLSLWLITLDRNRPFTFLDHHIRCGDTLLGVSSIAQLESFNLAAESDAWTKQNSLYISSFTKDVVKEAAAKVAEISDIPVLEIADAERKERLYREVVQTTQELRVIADLLVASSFETSQARGTAFIEHISGYWNRLKTLLEQDLKKEQKQSLIDELLLIAQHAVEKEAPSSQKPRRMFHWPIEFPEVFEAGGFNAVVGNPPFIGGQKLTGNLGEPFREYLVNLIGSGKRGSADICAYFFLRAAQIITSGGTAGLIATNTIAQGDTREVGLDQLRERGIIVYRANPSVPWPGDAAVEVAHLWFVKERWRGEYILADRKTTNITSYLTPPGRITGKPLPLPENSGKSFQGSIVLGMGFVLEPNEAQALMHLNPRNKEVISPYLNGEDLNSRPDQSASRWVINFHDWPIERAMEYPEAFKIIEERVKPERQRRKHDGTYALRKPLPQKWWIYAEKRPALYSAIRGMEKIMVCSEVTKHLAFQIVKNTGVFSSNLDVFVSDDFGLFAVLQSDLHELWARRYCSTLESRLKYSPGNAFQTFPFPLVTPELRKCGEDYFNLRGKIMLERNIGLTTAYNQFHNPEDFSDPVVEWRTKRQALLNCVLEAYSFKDLSITLGFVETARGTRFGVPTVFHDELLQRLLSMNLSRAFLPPKSELQGAKLNSVAPKSRQLSLL